MPDKVINKVVYGGNTLIDITDTTATESDVASGESFYLASGVRGVGTATYAGSATANGPATKTVAIPYGECDTTSTSTVFTATVAGITSLYDGVCVYLKNGVVTSASGWTLNINNLGAYPVYQSQAAASRTSTVYNVAYTGLFIFNSTRIEGGCWDYFYGYNSDTNTTAYQIRRNQADLVMHSKLYRYQICFSRFDGTLLPANGVSNTTGTSKTLTTESFDPFGLIFYYSTTTAVEANTSPAAGYMWQEYPATDLRYSFNAGTTLTAKSPVFVKCSPQSDGSFKLAGNACIVQALPNTADGYAYIYLGRAYDTYRISLDFEHPIYYYSGGAMRLWTNSANSLPSGGTSGQILTKNSGTDFDASWTTFTETDPTVPAWSMASSNPSYTASEVGAVATSAVGAASGVAPLNASSKIDETYLPSYVDDVIEGYLYNGTFYKEAAHTTAITAEAGKIYVDLATDKTYRYGGSTYVEISSGTTVSVSRDLTSGTKIGTITVNGTETDIYAPTPPTKVSDLTNDSGFISGITSSDVTTALGFTPYNSTNPNGYVNASGAASAAPVQSVNGETGAVTLDIPEVPDWALEENPPTYALSYDENSIGNAYTNTSVTIEPNYTPSGDVKQTMETIEYISGGDAVLDFTYSDYVLSINGVMLPEITTKKVATSAPTFVGSGVKFAINSNVDSNAVGTGAADYMEI